MRVEDIADELVKVVEDAPTGVYDTSMMGVRVGSESLAPGWSRDVAGVKRQAGRLRSAITAAVVAWLAKVPPLTDHDRENIDYVSNLVESHVSEYAANATMLLDIIRRQHALIARLIQDDGGAFEAGREYGERTVRENDRVAAERGREWDEVVKGL